MISRKKILHDLKVLSYIRFIDDLITINNKNFAKNIRNIYQPELELKKENQINKNANFLDLKINIQNSRFQIKLYYKREHFNFNIIRVPYKSCNIPHKIFHSVMSGEIPGYVTKFQKFIKSAKIFIGRIIKQGV